MHRRTVLTGLTALPLAQFRLNVAWSETVRSTSLSRVRPGDPGWPSSAEWSELSRQTGGRLIPVQPLLSACAQDPGTAACREVLSQLKNPLYISDQAGGTQVSGWADAWVPASSVHAVAAQAPSDVIAGVNFARKHNLRLAVKGGGHSYQGTSNAPDSLLIWLHAMQDIKLLDAFVPRGGEGRVAPVSAVSVEAGALWIDVYDAVTTKAGRYVQGGGCTTVGVAGLIQSGGFGSFSKGFGAAAASLLQADIVTADGMLRTVNDFTDPDLFWALKGGGGGSWGVLTRLTLRTYELPQYFGAVEGAVKAKSAPAFRRMLDWVLEFYCKRLFNPHWGEQIVIGPDNTLRLAMTCQGMEPAAVAQLWQPLFQRILASPDLTVTKKLWAGAGLARHWWDPVYRQTRGNDSMRIDPRPGAPNTRAWWTGDQDQVGSVIYAYESAWLPDSLLQKDARSQLLSALFAASRHHEVELHFNKGLAGTSSEAVRSASRTAINPQVLRAFALAIVADGGRPAYPGMPRSGVDFAAARKAAAQVAKAMGELKTVAPDAGSYVSESNYFEPDWALSFWGSHYPRLREVKAKYDPQGLFFVHHGVGSEAWSADGFTPLAAP